MDRLMYVVKQLIAYLKLARTPSIVILPFLISDLLAQGELRTSKEIAIFLVAYYLVILTVCIRVILVLGLVQLAVLFLVKLGQSIKHRSRSIFPKHHLISMLKLVLGDYVTISYRNLFRSYTLKHRAVDESILIWLRLGTSKDGLPDTTLDMTYRNSEHGCALYNKKEAKCSKYPLKSCDKLSVFGKWLNSVTRKERLMPSVY